MTEYEPFEREWLEPGSHLRAKLVESCDTPGEYVRTARLLVTIDYLFLGLDELRAENDRLRAEIEESARVRRLQFERDMQVKSAQMKAERNANRYAALPEDVQVLQEEVAAWKDNYANVDRVNKVLRSDKDYLLERADGLEKTLAKVRKNRKYWKKQAISLAEAVAKLHMTGEL